MIASAIWLRVFGWVGSDFYTLSTLSVVFSAATAVLLYIHTQKIIAPMLWLASGVVVSQSTIVELYAPVVFLIVLAYHLDARGYRVAPYLVIGLGLATHHLMGLFWIGLVVRDIMVKRQPELSHTSTAGRRLWVFLMPVAVALPFYAYIPIFNDPPYLTIAGNALGDYLNYFTSQTSLIGGLAILGPDYFPSEDLKERAFDFLRVVLQFGPALVPLGIAWRLEWKAGRFFLPLMLAVFFIYYATDLAPQVYTYTMPGIALAIILLSKVELSRLANYAVVLFAFGALIFNFWLYDIKTVDRDQAAYTFYQDLDALPEGSILWSHNRGWEKMTTELYNLDHAETRRPIDTLTIRQPRPGYLELIKKLNRAESHGELFETVVVSKNTAAVVMIPATAARVLGNIDDTVLLEWGP